MAGNSMIIGILIMIMIIQITYPLGIVETTLTIPPRRIYLTSGAPPLCTVGTGLPISNSGPNCHYKKLIIKCLEVHFKLNNIRF